MNEAACSWRVSTSSIRDVRRDSTTARFSSPGRPKMRWTPSFSSALTRRSDPLVGIVIASSRCGGISFLPEIEARCHFRGEVPAALFISCGNIATIAPAEWSLLGKALALTDVWARKSVIDLIAEASHADPDSEVRPLRRVLSAVNLISLGIGGIVGAGIFVLTGHAAAANAGPAITLSFLFAAVACGLAGLCYAELSSTVPISGSAYTYSYATMGELIAWIIGWDLILEYAIGAGTVAIGWSAYVVCFARDFGITSPAAYVSAPFAFDADRHSWSATGAILNVPAVAIVVAMTVVLVIGIRETSRINDVIVAVKLIVIGLFIIFAAHAFSFANWVTASNPGGNFIPPNAG